MNGNIGEPGSLFNALFLNNIQYLDGNRPNRDSGALAPAAEHVMAVYTDVATEDLAQFLTDYDIGDLLAYKGIAEGVENSNFLVHTSQGNFILTLYEKRVAAKDLPFFLGLMEHLHARGITCPQPVQNRKGDVLGTIAGRPAAIITFLDGLWIRRPSPNHCAALGTALAKLHLAGLDFPGKRANALSVDGWRPLYEHCSARANEVHRDLQSFLAKELGHLEQNWPYDLPEGVIHADLFPDNVFFLGEKLSGLIDFYFACTDALAYDVAICLNAWCFETDHSYNVTKGKGLLQAYTAVRPLSAEERRALPLLARGAALRFLLTRLVDWFDVPQGALVRPKDPMEYFRKLRFHQAVKSVRDYGIDG
jgi:homoserine kinase type II